MKDTLDSHIEDLIELKGQARDTSMVKRLVVGLFVLIIPFLVAGVVKAIQSDNDVAHLQKQADVQAQRGEQVQRDVGVIKADIREFGARQEALRRDLDQDIGQVQRTLDRIEESNERRRPR